MTAEEIVEYEKLALAREDGRPPDDARSTEEQSVHPVWWLDYWKKVVKTARTSLIVDPADGKIPPQTAEGRERAAARRAAARTHGPADSYENRSLQERGLPLIGMRVTTFRRGKIREQAHRAARPPATSRPAAKQPDPSR